MFSKGRISPRKRTLLHHSHHIYRTATKIYPNMSVSSITCAAQYVPQLEPPPIWAINRKMQKRGNLCITATVFKHRFVLSEKFQRVCKQVDINAKMFNRFLFIL